jgi:PAS domain S-box-containing protein
MRKMPPRKMKKKVQSKNSRKAAEVTDRTALAERYKYLFEESPVLNIIISSTGKVRYVNKSVAVALDYSLSEIVGKDALELVVPKEREKVASALGRGFEHKSTPSIAVDVTAKDGTIHTLLFSSGHVLLEGSNNLNDMLLTGVDITERNLSERALRESEERYRALFENSLDAILLTTPEGKILAANPEACRSLQRSEKELRQLGMGKVVDLADQKIQAALQERARTGRFRGELNIKRKDDTFFPAEVATTTFRQGEIERASLIIRDVTNSRRSERKLIALYRHALQLTLANTVDDIVKGTLDAMEFTLGFDNADFWIVRDGSLDVRGFRGKPFKLSTLPMGGPGVVARVARTKNAYLVSDTRREPSFLDDPVIDYDGKALHMKSELAVPVLIENELEAVLNVESIEINTFTQDDQMLLETLATRVASALTGLRQRDSLQRYSEHLEELVAERTRKLAESETRFRDLADLLPQMVYEIDERGNFTFVNRNGLKSTGYTEEDLQAGLNAIQVLAEKDRERAKDNLQRVLVGEHIAGTEYSVQGKAGGTIPVITHSNAIIRDGKPVGLRGIAIDITQRKQMEETLQRNLEQFAALDAIVLEITQPHQLSKLLSKITELAVHLLGGQAGALYLCDPESQTVRVVVDYHHARDYSGTVLKYGEGAAGTVAKTGRPLIIDDYSRWEGRAMVYEGEAPFGTAVVAPLIWRNQVIGTIDVTDDTKGQKFTEEDLRLLTRFATHAAIAVENTRLIERLLNAERLAGILDTASMVAHDLRNPLQGIAAAAYVLKTDPLAKEERDEMIQLIENSVEYSDGIVKDLLDYSRTFQLALVEITPKEIVLKALQAVKVPEIVKIQDMSHEQPIISVDPDRIKRVLVNLFENAVDSMPQGGSLTISTAESNGSVEITISDTGNGIPKEIIENLWNPLHTTKAKGMGMGLAICKRLVDAHGGDISVRSKTEEGTTVTIHLPIRPRVVIHN